MVTFNEAITLQKNSPRTQRGLNYSVAAAQPAHSRKAKQGPSALQLPDIPASGEGQHTMVSLKSPPTKQILWHKLSF